MCSRQCLGAPIFRDSQTRLIAFGFAMNRFLGICGLGLGLMTVGAQAASLAETEIAPKVAAARAILDKWQAEKPERGERKLHLVLWTPNDREPAPRYRERLTAIMEDIRDFYAKEMNRMGFGPRTIRLDYAKDGLLNIHLVRGRQPYSHYSTPSGSEIRTECIPTLLKEGVNIEKETIVLFCNMSNWDPQTSKVSQNSPYYASGTHRDGTAWQVDSPILDLQFLDKKQPMVQDGQYGNISIGKYNSIFIGGICHELGHALNLPHNEERPDEKAAFGTSLMGSGNRSYGDDRRGEGLGTFLTLAQGLRLASHPIFCGSVKGMDLPANAKISDLQVTPIEKGFRVTGKVTGSPPVYAVTAYMDPTGGSDYDATSCSSVPDSEGRFTLDATALEAGKGAMFRMIAVQANGAAVPMGLGQIGPFDFPYYVNKDGSVDLSAFEIKQKLGDFENLVAKGQADQAKAEYARVQPKLSPKAREVADSMIQSFQPRTKTPAELEAPQVYLSQCKPTEEKVGWGRPSYDRYPGENVLFSADGQVHAHGIYAHSKGRHVYDLGGKWREFSGTAANVGYGKVQFRILGDGKELWKSRKMEDSAAAFKVPVAGVQKLELIVDDGDDGGNGDGCAWMSPLLVK